MTDKARKSPKKEETKWNEEERTKLDSFEEQKFVDDIPLEDLKLEQQEEKQKKKTKDDSQSERKYKHHKRED